MTYKDICEANQTIMTTPIKGKEYANVNQRIKAFRMLCPNGCIKTEIISIADGVCVMKASVYDDASNLLGTGTAYEKETSSFINKTSYIENCETSAVGRALGMLGIGIDVSMASYEEVANAMKNQEETPIDPKQKAKLLSEINKRAVTVNQILYTYGLKSIDDMNQGNYEDCLARLSNTPMKEAKANE